MIYGLKILIKIQINFSFILYFISKSSLLLFHYFEKNIQIAKMRNKIMKLFIKWKCHFFKTLISFPNPIGVVNVITHKRNNFY